MRTTIAWLMLLTACGGTDPPTDQSSLPPLSSPTPEVEDFNEQWCLAAVPLLDLLDEDLPFPPGNAAAISDLTVAADALDRLVSDLQDAGLSAPASDTRSLAARVRELIAAIDVRGEIGVGEFIESNEAQVQALKRMLDSFDAPVASFGRCSE